MTLPPAAVETLPSESVGNDRLLSPIQIWLQKGGITNSLADKKLTISIRSHLKEPFAEKSNARNATGGSNYLIFADDFESGFENRI